MPTFSKTKSYVSALPLMLAIRNTDEPRLAPPADEMIWVGTILGVMGTRDVVGRFALDNECRSLAFPAISCGVFGYPLDEAAKVERMLAAGDDSAG